MTLHYLSEGCSMHSSPMQIAWGYYVGKSTVHCVIKETCDALWEQLAPIYLKEPTVTEWSNIADGFYNRWNMPNCIGALDDKHFLIQSPKHSGSNFFNYKHSFSIVVMATCDAFYRFTLVDIGGAGSNHDSTVFKKSVFGEALLENQLVIPETKNLPGTSHEVPHVFVEDQAFPLHNNIMRPYPGKRLSEKKNIFNLRLSRARRCIENTFGILAQRWRILRKSIIADVTMCDKIVKAAVVLHNYVQSEEIDIPISERRYCPTGFADYVDVTGQLHVGYWADEEPGLRSVGRVGANNASRSVLQNRDKLADFFVSNNGYVPWQWDQVNRGRIPLN